MKWRPSSRLNPVCCDIPYGTQPVDHAEVQHLGDASLFAVHIVDGHVEHLAGGGGMNVLAASERFQQAMGPGTDEPGP